GQRSTIHCTITGQMMKRPGYLEGFLKFWTPRPEIKKVWFSMFTPQVGDQMPEILTPAERLQAIEEMLVLRKKYPKLDMPERVLRELAHPPKSPQDCIFAMTTETMSADLETMITPCQFGGTPDCASCGGMASMGLAAVGAYTLGGFIRVGGIFKAANRIGQRRARTRLQAAAKNLRKNPLQILHGRDKDAASRNGGISSL